MENERRECESASETLNKSEFLRKICNKIGFRGVATPTSLLAGPMRSRQKNQTSSLLRILQEIENE